MTTEFGNRPTQLKLALSMGLGALVLGFVPIVQSKDALGDAWLLVIFGKAFISILYLVMFILAFNGAKWPRVVFIVLLGLGIARYASNDFGHFLEPIIGVITVLNIFCVLLWFHPKVSHWYAETRKNT